MSRTQSLNAIGMGILGLGMAAGTLPACDTEVGQEYTGEALLQIRGEVSSDRGVSEDRVLALAVVDRDPSRMWIVDGDVVGEFPSRFEFTVTQPPPDESIVPSGEKHRIGSTEAYFALVPREHPESVTRGFVGVENEPDISWQGTFPLTETYCPHLGPWESPDAVDSEDCVVRQLECSYEPCRLESSSNDAGVEPLDARVADVLPDSERCHAGRCYSTWVVCDPEQGASSCQVQVHSCDVSQSGADDRFYGPVVRRCSFISETGDPALSRRGEYELVNTNFKLIYSAADVPEGSELLLKRGYNLQALVPFEEWLEESTCWAQAQVAAYEQCSSELGNSVRVVPRFDNDDDAHAFDTLEQCVGERLPELEQDCGTEYWGEIIEDPQAADLHIDFYHTWPL